MQIVTPQTYTIIPDYEVIGNIKGMYTMKEITEEDSLITDSNDELRKLLYSGEIGPITSAFLNAISYSRNKIVRESKICTLLSESTGIVRGDSPRVHWWHMDGKLEDTDVYQILCNVSNHPEGVSNTPFFAESIDLMVSDSESKSFGSFDGKIKQRLHSNPLTSLYNSKDGDLILMTNKSLHKSTPAKVSGWRRFMRVYLEKL